MMDALRGGGAMSVACVHRRPNGVAGAKCVLRVCSFRRQKAPASVTPLGHGQPAAPSTRFLCDHHFPSTFDRANTFSAA